MSDAVLTRRVNTLLDEIESGRLVAPPIRTEFLLQIKEEVDALRAQLAEAREENERLKDGIGERDLVIVDLNARADQEREEREEAESFKAAHEYIVGDGWLERAHAVARKEPGRLGSNVWHIAVERAERLAAAEAELARLRKIIEDAPHESDCRLGSCTKHPRVHTYADIDEGCNTEHACDCFKSKAAQAHERGEGT